MNDSRIDDRRDVAHSTDPIGSHETIEQNRLGRPLNADADTLPAVGAQSRALGLPLEDDPDEIKTDPYSGTPHRVPPARTGQAENVQAEAEARGAGRIDPATRIPEPVTQDLGFSRNAVDGERR